jgi:hypothetical protein
MRKKIGGKNFVMADSFILLNGSVPSIHAEDNALRKCLRLNRHKRFLTPNLKIDVFVMRVTNTTGKKGFSRPCRFCLLRLAKSKLNFNNIYYTDANGNIVVEKFNTMLDSPLTKISSGIARKRMKEKQQSQQLSESKNDNNNCNPTGLSAIDSNNNSDNHLDYKSASYLGRQKNKYLTKKNKKSKHLRND